MKKRILSLIAIVTLSATLNSCEVVNGMLDQMAGLANLSNCEYSLKNVSNLTIAGVNVKNLTNGNITASDVVKLSTALLAKKVPMDMNVNIDVKNPTSKDALLSALDWIMEIDGAQFATGTKSSSTTITKNATTTVPLGVNTDIYNLFSSNGLESLKRFVGSFTNDGTSSKVGLKIKPSLNVGTYQVPYPNYITLEKKTGNSGSTGNTGSNNSGNTGGKPTKSK